MSEENLFRLRVAYVKQGRLRYLGHLEVLRTIERIVRRAGLPYAVTQGFSPHMKISFTSALPVGTASVCEWYDVYLETYVPARRALSALRKASPADLAPYAAGYVDLRAASLSAALTHAAYRATVELDDASSLARHLPQGAPSVGRALQILNAFKAHGSITYIRGRKNKKMDLVSTLDGAMVTEFVREKDPHAKAESLRAPKPGEVGDLWGLALVTRSSEKGALRPEVLIRAWEMALSLWARDENHGLSAEEVVAEVLAEPLAVQPYGVFAHYEVTRVSQQMETKDGKLVEPLPRPQDASGR